MKFARDIIILHMCTNNHKHMMHGSWDMECNRQNFLSLWTIFCPFTPLWTQKIKVLKKMKEKPGDIIILHTCTKTYVQIMYGSWDMVHDRLVIFHFWQFFALLQPKKSKFWKNEKNTWRYHHFTYEYQKLWSDDVPFLRYGAWQMYSQCI